jgi:hypothetical protein
MPVRGTRREASHSSARAKSEAVVIFSSAGSPATAATLSPAARATLVSSVGTAPSRIDRLAKRSRRKAWGVCTRTTPFRSTAPRSGRWRGRACRAREAPEQRHRRIPAAQAGGRSRPAGRTGGRRRGRAPRRFRCAPARRSPNPPARRRPRYSARRRCPRAPPGRALLSRADDDPDRGDRRMGGKRLHGPAKHRLAAEHPVLLGDSAAEALAFAGRDDEGCHAHEPHPDRSRADRRAGDPGADDGRHRPAVPADRQALRRRPDGQRDDRQPGDDPRDPPVAAEGAVGPLRGAGVAAACRLRAQEMAEAAKLNEERGAAIIDINMGCPVKKVVNGDAGSALMRDLPLAAAIIAATVKAVKRAGHAQDADGLGPFQPQRARARAHRRGSGVRMITSTAAPAARCTRAGRLELRRKVKQAVAVPVIVNGDIARRRCREALEQSGADGVMIGRGAYGRPWLLGQVMASWPMARLDRSVARRAARHDASPI